MSRSVHKRPIAIPEDVGVLSGGGGGSGQRLEIRRSVLDHAGTLGPFRAVRLAEGPGAGGDILAVSVSLSEEEAMTLTAQDAILWHQGTDYLAAARRCCWVVVRRVG